MGYNPRSTILLLENLKKLWNTINIGISAGSLIQLLIGLSSQQRVVTTRCYSNKTPLYTCTSYISRQKYVREDYPAWVTKFNGTLLLLKAKKGRETARVGINDNKNDRSKAILADKEVFVNLFVVDVANIEDDEGSEDDIVGTIKNLSADEIASGFDNIVFVMPDSDDTEEAPDDAEI